MGALWELSTLSAILGGRQELDWIEQLLAEESNQKAPHIGYRISELISKNVSIRVGWARPVALFPLL